MAITRKNAEMPSMPTSETEITEFLTSKGADSQSTAVPLSEIAKELADTPEAVWAVLDVMETNGKADLTGTYKSSAWWLLNDSEKVAETPKPKRVRRTKTQKEADDAKAREALEYATRLAEGQDEILSQAQDDDARAAVPTAAMMDARDETLSPEERKAAVRVHNMTSAGVFQPAPDALPKGTVITLESGAEATVIADEVITIKRKPMRAVLTAMMETTRLRRNEATNVRDGYETPEEITTLPERPQGVNENVWHMVHNAHSVSERDTLSARLFWIKRALAQHEASLNIA